MHVYLWMNWNGIFNRHKIIIFYIWFIYIDDIFFVWTHGEKKLQKFVEKLNKLYSNIKFTHESSKENIPILDLNVKLSGG